jgi:hypothetical protein
MGISTRTEKAILKVIAERQFSTGKIEYSKTGNHTMVFEDIEGAEIARFTLRSIVGKRLKKRKVTK